MQRQSRNNKGNLAEKLEGTLNSLKKFARHSVAITALTFGPLLAYTLHNQASGDISRGIADNSLLFLQRVEEVGKEVRQEVRLEERLNQTYSGELRDVLKHSKRIGIEPELLLAVRFSENGNESKAYGIVPQGSQADRYEKDSTYVLNGEIFGYVSPIEKQMCWAGWTIKRNMQRFNAQGNSTLDFISFLAESYPSEKDKDVWEKNVRYWYNRLKRDDLPVTDAPKKSNQSVSVESFKMPVYSDEKVPANYCSRYVRIAGRDLFGKSFPAQDAWNMRYHTEVVSTSENLSLDDLENSGVLKPGMIVGAVWPNSKYNSRTDENGNKVKYTHVALYVGPNIEGEPILFHKFGKRTIQDTEESFRRRGLMPVEVLNSN